MQRLIMSHIRMLLTVCLTLPMLVAGTSARADGILFSNGVFRQPLESHVTVTIKNKIATTELEQTFQNPLDKQVSAIYIAPAPSGATISGFAELIDGRWQTADIQARESAQLGYDSAASKGEDAAIVDGIVSQAPSGVDPSTTFETRVVLPAQSTRSIRLTYTQVLVGSLGLTRYSYPLSSTDWTEEPVGDLLVHVNIVENSQIRALYSPSHGDDVQITRPDDSDAELVYHAQNVVPKQNFEVVYTQSEDKFAINLASYREANDQDGYFVLIASPQLQAQASDIVQKDFVFVLDTSGSMDGPKLVQAKSALNHILDALHPGDRFTIINFSSDVTAFSPKLLPVIAEQSDKAKLWVDRLSADSGTNINQALLTALRTVDSDTERPHIVVLLTDGQPTDGETALPAILNNVKRAISSHSRLFTIGVGEDVNEPLLDALAQNNRGTALMVTQTDKLEQKLDAFYAAINSPVLVDLGLDFGSMDVYDMQPNPIPDMFLEGQVVVTGRYKAGGTATITLTGNVNGQKQTSTYKDIAFIGDSVSSKPYSYVSRLWAQRKVDSLVEDLAIHGDDEKKMEQVKALGLQFHIVTPYTSFIVTDKSVKKAAPTPSRLGTTFPKTGMPFLYVDNYRTVNTALMIVGTLLMMAGLGGTFLARRRKSDEAKA